jgi:hypothetical protein
LLELAQRREALVARAELQRARLAREYQRFDGPVRIAGAAFTFASALGRSPLALTATAALLAKTPWRKLARLPKLAWRGWKIIRLVRRLKG